MSMSFITKLPNTSNGYNTIWVVDDYLTKSATTYQSSRIDKIKKLTKTYLKVIVKIDGVPISFTFDRYSRFTSWFLDNFAKVLGNTPWHKQESPSANIWSKWKDPSDVGRLALYLCDKLWKCIYLWLNFPRIIVIRQALKLHRLRLSIGIGLNHWIVE